MNVLPALIIVQARMGSTRLPGKSMANLRGKPVLWHLFNQIRHCRQAAKPMLATTDRPGDDALAEYAMTSGWTVFRGSDTDVLDRYYMAARQQGATALTPIVRLTGDDVFTDPSLVDAAIQLYNSMAGRCDVVLTDMRDGYLPYGGGVSLFSFRALEAAQKNATAAYDREHVGPYIFRNNDLFPALEIVSSRAHPGIPLSIDTAEDLQRATSLLAVLEQIATPPYSLSDILAAADRLGSIATAHKAP